MRQVFLIYAIEFKEAAYPQNANEGTLSKSSIQIAASRDLDAE
ncbi:hypothetical protein [Granulicella mallensis]|jgi:hypothetical protein|uniref:Uncharacterized protein n=1 Tax=Granulicella mallensis TaxID=940614 RepID=A0A7W7ZUV7_9BACT|nr:hypothetical protein [Granulicella mallensis]MBB5066600.1 hypothetical protein [Granulicella mallensis]